MENTISGIATALVESGIGIIRISGNQAVEIAGKILRTKGGRPLDIRESHRIRYGFVFDGEKEIDEVLVSTFLAPKSFTGEDTVEINCHGGILLMQKVFQATLKAGARPAEPGEFSKRAFLNGRIDLSQAEADLIAAKSEDSIRSSLSLLQGSLKEKIKRMRSRILEDTAFIEAALDDPEHISLEGFSEQCQGHVEEILSDIQELLKHQREGRLLKEGIQTVIVGKPNAGKSSLLNCLVKADKAIVSNIPGTTRDTVEADIRIGSLSLHLIDTAGIRETEDIVEEIGVNRAKEGIEKADCVLLVLDGSLPLEEDRKILALLEGKKAVVLLNKMDKESILQKEELEKLSGFPVLPISAKEGSGMEELGQKLEELFYTGSLSFSTETYIHSERQIAALEEAKSALELVLEGIRLKLSEDFLSIDLMGAYSALGRILGEDVSEDLINEIFAKFCMGK